jgi:hypothetical protein
MIVTYVFMFLLAVTASFSVTLMFASLLHDQTVFVRRCHTVAVYSIW